MKSGFKLIWTDRAIRDLKNIIDYLSDNWTYRELQKFAQKLDKRLIIIASNPSIFPQTSKRKNVRKSVLTKHTVIYYKQEKDGVIILTLFDPRQNPKKLKI